MRKPDWQTKDGQVKLYLADCTDLLPQIKADAVLTDPPYGIGGAAWAREWHGDNGDTKLWGDEPNWDRVDQPAVSAVRRIAPEVIIWGGNFYELSASRCWLVWDKLQSGRGADCELAWTNLDLAPKCFRMSRIDAYHNKAKDKKVHPCQKPVPLMKWCLGLFSSNCKTIFDPFGGSGSTPIACLQMGLACVCVEKDPDIFQMMVKRVESAARNRGFGLR